MAAVPNPDWPDERLFDAWFLRGTEFSPVEVSWPEPLDGMSSQEKERWGYLMAKRAIFDEMEGARVIYRGDAFVWESSADCSYQIVGDFDVSWEGRSPIFEVKAFLPAYRLRQSRGEPCQGLDWPQRQDYLNEQKRSGRPFYVVWVWPEPDGAVVLRGERVDLLAWPPHLDSLNRRRNVKGAKMAYWYVSSLRTMDDLVADISCWAGQPYQAALV